MKITKGGPPAVIPELRGNLAGMRYPAFCEIKYDGEACIINYDELALTKIITTNKYGTMRSEWHKLDEIATILEEKEIKKGLFLGEIFFADGKAGRLYDLLSNKDNDDLGIKIYDVIRLVNDVDMQANKTPLIDRKEILTELFYPTNYYISPYVVQNKQEAELGFKNATDEGFEGVVVKPMDGFLTMGPCNWVKMKKKDQTDYQVSKIDPVKERIEIMVPFVPGTAYLPTKGNWIGVGCKVSNKVKKLLKVGDWVTIEHLGVLPSGSLRNPVYIKKVDNQNLLEILFT